MASLAVSLRDNVLAGQRCDPGGPCRPLARPPRRPGADAIGAEPADPDKIVTQKSVENALRVLMAIGGSTQRRAALTAMPRAGVEIDLRHLNEISDTKPSS